MAQPNLDRTGLLTAVQRFSLNDGPGIRTTVFFKGCNLRCAWCHNPETIALDNQLMTYPERCIGCGHCVEVCPVGAHFKSSEGIGFDRALCLDCGKCAEICFPGAMTMAARKWTIAQVMAEIRQDIGYYRDSGGGVTLSGGEVFCQPMFADGLAVACQAEGIPVAVETNLNWDFGSIRPALEKMSLVMFDIKLADPEAHRRWTGADNGRILGNLRKLDELDIPLIARTPLIPDVTDSDENVSAVAELIAPLRNLLRYELLNFNPLGASKYRALHQDDHFAQANPLEKERLAELALIERNPTLSKNLAEMADINFRMADGAPQTMREAIQWMCWFSMLSRLYNRGSAGGQLDQLLLPYYEKDIQAGRLTDDEARFYLGYLFFNDSRYYQLGGPDMEGNDTINRLSYLILEAANEVNIACNLTVRVHDKTDPVFLRKAVGYLFGNRNGWPRFSGDAALVKGFMRCGFPREEAIRRISSGCHWMSIPGKEYTLNDIVKINAAKVFEVAWREMMGAGDPSLERLHELFLTHLRLAVEATADGIRFHLDHQDKNEPELILNLLSHGPVEKGADVTKSAAYFNLCMDGAALATVADSFAAVEQRVVREKRLTFAELDGWLSADFAGTEGEYIRQMLLASERYCQGESLGDRWAIRVSREYSELVRAQNQRYPGLNFIPGWFSWSNNIYFGKHVGATPNGRKAGTAINHGANPHPGFRRDGAVTAMCNSIAAIQPGYGNTAPEGRASW